MYNLKKNKKLKLKCTYHSPYIYVYLKPKLRENPIRF